MRRHSPMSMAPMLKSPSHTGLHVAMRVRKGEGIGGSLVAAPIKLSIPEPPARVEASDGCGSRDRQEAVEYV